MEKGVLLIVCSIGLLILLELSLSELTAYYAVDADLGLQGVFYPAVYLNSTSYANHSIDNLTCYATAASDGENVSYNGFWYREGELIYLNSSITNFAHNGTNSTKYWGEIIADSQDNIYVAGTAVVNDNVSYFALAKFDNSLSPIWNVTLRAVQYNIYTGSTIALDSQDNILIGGTSVPTTGANIASLAKYNSSGSLLWHTNYSARGAISEDLYNFGGPAIDSNDSIITGHTFGVSLNSNDTAVLFKFNSSGAYLWNVTLSNQSSPPSGGILDVAVDSQDNIIATGNTNFSGPNWDSQIFKLNSSGTVLWNRTFNLSNLSSNTESLTNVVIDSNDDIYALSFDTGYIPNALIKVNSSGSLVWSIDGRFMRITLGKNKDSIYALNYSYISKINFSGSVLWSNPISNFSTNSYWEFPDLAEDLFGGFYISSSMSPNGTIFHLHGFNASNNVPDAQILLSTLPFNQTRGGENWSCSVRASNGTSNFSNYSNYVDSNSVFIGRCDSNTQCYCDDVLLESRTLNASDYLQECSEGRGIWIFNSSVNLDCNGSKISGQNIGYGIELIFQANNINITNCTISNFEVGINATNTQSNIVKINYNNISNMRNYWVYLSNMTNVLFSYNTIQSASSGYFGSPATSGSLVSANVTDNIVDTNYNISFYLYNVSFANNIITEANGITMGQSGNYIFNNSITCCASADNSSKGINLGTNNSIDSNTISNCYYGVYASAFGGSFSLALINNHINSDMGMPIYIYKRLSSVYIANNIFSGGSRIYLENPTGTYNNNTIINNTFSNLMNGLFFKGLKNFQIINNTITNVACSHPSYPCSGLYFQSTSTFNNITGNKIYNVSNTSIHIADSSSTNNLIVGNVLCNNSKGIINYTYLKAIGNNTFCLGTLSPENGSTAIGLFPSFSFNASKVYLDDATNCTLDISGFSNNVTGITHGAITTIYPNSSLIKLSTYLWDINCTDKYTNYGRSAVYTIYTSAFCGDYFCDTSENCTACPTDCGACVQNPPSGGSGSSNPLKSNEPVVTEKTKEFKSDFPFEGGFMNQFDEGIIPVFSSSKICNGIKISAGDYSFSMQAFGQMPWFRFDLSKGEGIFCPWCYNGKLDYDELEIDCGPSCKSCSEPKFEKQSFWTIYKSLIIMLLLLMIVSILIFFWKRKSRSVSK